MGSVESIGEQHVQRGMMSTTYKQGCFWYDAIPAMPDDRRIALLSADDECVREHAVLREIFGLL
jgi:hypothetical protein